MKMLRQGEERVGEMEEMRETRRGDGEEGKRRMYRKRTCDQEMWEEEGKRKEEDMERGSEKETFEKRRRKKGKMK